MTRTRTASPPRSAGIAAVVPDRGRRGQRPRLQRAAPGAARETRALRRRIRPDIDRQTGKINVGVFGSRLMWRSISLRQRLNLMFAVLLLLWLAADVDRILANAGPRVQAEARSVSRLTQEFIVTSLAG